MPQPIPAYGRRLIPKLVDEIAQSDPSRPFISLQRSPNVEDGFEDVSYETFATAVNRCSWWIESELGHGEIPTPLAYIGPLDLRYLFVLIAAAKTGNIAFFSSHRNSLAAHISLLETIQCNTILLPNEAPTITKQILTSKRMRVLRMPDLKELMTNGSDVQVYPWDPTFAEMKDKTFVILHTSGSTGIPKPVFVSHGTFASNDAHQLIPSLGGNPTTVHLLQNKRMFLAFPLFHSAGLNFAVGFSVFAGLICVLPKPGPLDIDMVNMIHTYGNVHGSLLPPSTVIDLYHKFEYRENMLRRLQFLAYVGGTLPKEVGDFISSKMRLITLMGSTETKLLPVELNTRKVDWEYLPISPFLGHEFRPSGEGLYELVVIRNRDYDLFQGVFSTFPSIDEYPMSDLYEQHPTNPALWAFRARADDIIALNNAEKLNPITMESVILNHPDVNAAVIGGHGEFQAALLVEPKIEVHSADDRAKLLEEIWPTIVRANRDCPAHGRILKNFVIFTSPGKPLPKAAKGTVQRRTALKLYADEFETLYASSKNQSNTQNALEDDQIKQTISTPYQIDSEMPVGEGIFSNDGAPEQQVKAHVAPNEGIGLVKGCTLAELDARIETVLQRMLPNVFKQHLKPALAQVVINTMTQALALPEYSNHSSATFPAAPSHTPQTLAKVGNASMSGSDLLPTEASSVEEQPNDNVRIYRWTKAGIEAGTDSSQSLRDCLYEAIASSTYLHDVNNAANLFDCGLDSLQVMAFVSEVNASLLKLAPRMKTISKKTVYDNPSIDGIMQVLESNVKDFGKLSLGEVEV